MPTPEEMLACQAEGHAWDQNDAIRRKGKIVVFWRCERSGCVREAAVDQYGHGRFKYHYPDGYREAGHGFMSRSDKRFWLAKAHLRQNKVVPINKKARAG